MPVLVATVRCLPLLGALIVPVAWCAGVQVQVLGPGGQGLAGAVVFVESPAAKAAARPVSGVEVVQQNRQFVPEVSVVTVGSSVSFPNRDTVRHHVYSFSPVKKFEIKLYVGTPANPVVFDQPGIAVLGCNIHDTMAAWVLVVDTPWYGQTDAQGRLALAAVPAGMHSLRRWHPGLPPGAPVAEQALSVPAQGIALAQVQMAGVRP